MKANPISLDGPHKSMMGSMAYIFTLMTIFLCPFSGIGFREVAFRLSDLPLFFAIFFTLVSALYDRKPLLAPVRLILSGVITLLGLFISLVVSDEDQAREIAKFMMIISWFLIPLVILNQGAVGPLRTIRLVQAWAIGSLIAASIGVLQHFGIIYLRDAAGLSRVTSAYRQAGLSIHPNTFGLYCALAYPFFLDRLLLSRGILTKLMALFSCLLLVYAANISGSRGALVLILAATFLVFFFFSVRAKILPLFLIAVVFIGIGLLAYGLGAIPQLGEGQSAVNRMFFGDPSADRADEQRLLFLGMVINSFLDHPLLGNGYNLYGLHDAFFGTLAAGGLIGFIGFVIRESVAISDFKVVLKRSSSISINGIPAVGLCVAYITWLLSLTMGYWMLERGGFVVIGLLSASAAVYALKHQHGQQS